MTSKIIELREKDALNQNGNGDWESVVQDKLVLEDGDSVVMHSCFVDTEATSNQKIVIEDDVTLNMELMYFINANIEYNTTANPDQVVDAFNENSIPAWTPTYEKYIMSVPRAVGGATGLGLINSINLDVAFTEAGFPSSGLIPAFNGTIQYVDIDGVTQTAKYQVAQFQYVPFFADKTNAVLEKPIVYQVTGPGDPDNPGIKYISPNYNQLLKKQFYSPTASRDEGLNGDYFLDILTNSVEITLPKGSYSPVQLCNYLNTELTKQNSDGTNLYGNKFLQKTGEGTSDETGYSREVAYSNTTTNAIGGFRSKDPFKFLYGANQVEFSYLDSEQLFALDQAHTSMFDSNGNAVVTYLPSSGNVLTSYSQVGFTHLSATDKNGNNYDFWGDKLGFDLDNLVLKGELVIHENVGYMGTDDIGIATYKFPDTAGINLTTNLASIDGLIDKQKNFFEPIGEVNATSDVNSRIVATNSVFNKADQFGYFLIEVKANMGGDFITSDANEPDIRAVVSRFYEQNAYVTGTEGDSVVYTHKGQPVFLDSFKCRILDSGKNLAENIGSDSTIFMQIIKKE